MSREEISDPRAFRWVESGVSGLARPREWDVVTAADCGSAGEECIFVALPGGRVLAEDGPAGVAGCAERALAGQLDPPYRAVAVRRDARTWAVGAVAIEVAELPEEIEGEELTLVVGQGGERSLTVDGRPETAGIETLERLAGGRFEAFVLQAARLAADVWEVRIDPV